MHYEGGIKSFVDYIHKHRGVEVLHDEIIYISGEQNGHDGRGRHAVQRQPTMNWCCPLPTISTPPKAVPMRPASRAALTRALNDYARKNAILKDSDKNLTGDDVREGLTAVISREAHRCPV